MGTRSLTARVAAAGAVLALAATACGSTSKSGSGQTSTTDAGTAAVSGPTGGSGETQGITATTITVGQLADVSGPVPGLFTGAVDGMDAWAAYVNSTGGIGGRKVIVDHKDAALSCTNYTNGIKSLISSTFAAVGTFSLVDLCGVAALKASPDFPDIEGDVLTPSPVITTLPNVYGTTPAASGYEDTIYVWIKQHYGTDAVQHVGALYGQAAQASYNAQVKAAKAAGFKYIYTRGFGNTETNYTSDILRMKAAGVEVADITNMNVTDAVDFLQQAGQQAFHPKVIIASGAYDHDFYKLLGDPSLAQVVVNPLNMSMFLGEDAAAVPMITTMTKWFTKTHPADPINLFVVEGFSSGLLFQQVMQTLGAHPTRSGLLAGLKNVHNFTADGLIAPANVGSKAGSYCIIIVRPQNGKYVRADPPKGWLCTGKFIKS